MSLSVPNKKYHNDSNVVGMVSFDLIDWKIFELFNEKEGFFQSVNHKFDSIKQFSRVRLMELKEDYCTECLGKKTALSLPLLNLENIFLMVLPLQAAIETCLLRTKAENGVSKILYNLIEL